MAGVLEYIFEIRKRNSSLGVELLGGVTHFFGNIFNLVATATVLNVGGLPLADGIIGGAWAGCLSCVLVGLMSNLPITASAGAGPNLVVAYTLALSQGRGGLGSYDAALTCCMAAGVIIMVLPATGTISFITDLVPNSLKLSICVGIGLLCSFVGLQQVGMVVRS